MTNSIRKGKAFERLIARELSALFNCDCHRGHQERDGADSPDIVGVPGWWIECKHTSRVERERWWMQAYDARQRADGPSYPIAVIWRKTGERTIWVNTMLSSLVPHEDVYTGVLVTLTFEDWKGMVKP